MIRQIVTTLEQKISKFPIQVFRDMTLINIIQCVNLAKFFKLK